MAIISIGSYNGRDVKYSDVTQKFTMNPYDGNSAMKAITGWNNTELSVQELSDSHNGVTIFAGRSDYSGIASGFKLRLAPVGAVFTATEKIEWKKYVDRDPVITQLLVKLSKEDMTDNGDGTYYIDVNYDVDKTYKYEQLSQTERWYFPENGPFDTTYTQTISFTDADTGRTTVDSYSIEYAETSVTQAELIVPKMISEATFAVQLFDAEPSRVYDAKNKVYSNVVGTAVFDCPEYPTYTDNDIELDLGMPQNDPLGSRNIRMTSEGDGAWLEGSENLMRVGTSFSVAFWFPPNSSSIETVVAKHGDDGTNSGSSHRAAIYLENNSVFGYFGGSILHMGTGSSTYNNCSVLSVSYDGPNDYTVNAWMNGVQTITAQSFPFTNLRDLVRNIALFARTVDDSIGANFQLSLTSKGITNLSLYDYAITAEKAGQIYRNQNNSLILGFSGSSNVLNAKEDDGYITKMIERYKHLGYPLRCYGVAFSGDTMYEFGPTALIKAPWLTTYGQTRPDITTGISSDRLVSEYGCDILLPSDASNFSNRQYLYQENDDGNASGGEYIYNVGQYDIQATNAGIKMYPMGCLPVDSVTLKRNVPWSQVQWNVYNEAIAVYPKTIDTLTWSTDSNNDYRTKPEYVLDTQHQNELYQTDLVEGKMADTFDPIGVKLLEEIYPSLETIVPVILPENIKNGDYIEDTNGPNVAFEFYVFNGDIHGNELNTSIETIVLGENTVTLSFTDQWGNVGSQEITVTYGPSLNAVLGEWTMDTIAPTTYEVTDASTFGNNFEVYGYDDTDRDEITIDANSRMVFPASTVAKLLTKTDTTGWFPWATEFGVMGWIEPNDVTTRQSIIGRGGNYNMRDIGINAGQFYVNYTGANDGTAVAIGPTLTIDTRIHVCIQLRKDASATSNIGCIWDCYINGVFSASLDQDWYESPIFQNCSFGGLSNNPTLDNFNSRLSLNATVDNWKYRNANWTAQEISDIYTAEL